MVDYLKEAMNIREKLLEHGRYLAIDNPDRLSLLECSALSIKILKIIDEIDMSMGFEHHDVGEYPLGISQDRIDELFIDFEDWYEIVKTPSKSIYDYVLKNFPKNKFQKILCVGDGECSHLGRKLAMKGYNVVSVDPCAKKEFSMKKRNGSGSLHVVKGSFFKTSTDMIDWADAIVGAKVPLCAEELIGLKKPTVFNISGNAEIYNMKFKGKPIKSSEELTREISKCTGVSVKKQYDEILGKEDIIFVCDPRERDR